MNDNPNPPIPPTSGSGKPSGGNIAPTAYVLLFYNLIVLILSILALLRPANFPATERAPWPDMLMFCSLFGIIGGAIHGLASLSIHLGNGTLHLRWTMFYLARPVIGAGMAVVTFLVLSSGIGGFKVEADLPLLAWAALAGLYSQPALDKLRDVFSTIFKTDAKREEKKEE